MLTRPACPPDEREGLPLPSRVRGPGRALTRGVVGWGPGAAAPPVTRYPLPPMGSIADRLAALLAEMEESDRRLAALAADARELIDRTDAMLAEDRPE